MSLRAKISGRTRSVLYPLADWMFWPLDSKLIKHPTNLRLLPDARHRYGGQTCLAEWCHTVGLFQSMMYPYLKGKPNPTILDIGCGTGKLALAAEPYLGQSGRYIGVDIQMEDIEFCQKHYPAPRFGFIHLKTRNPFYVNDAEPRQPWPISNESVDMITALSVWTHFREEDAVFYLLEAQRTLRLGATALLTFFLLDETYARNIPVLTGGRYLFDARCSGSEEWYYPSRVNVPEAQIGVTSAGINRMLRDAGCLRWIDTYAGFWKGGQGLFVQDVLVLQKIR